MRTCLLKICTSCWALLLAQRKLEIPVVKTIASRQEGLTKLKENIDIVLDRKITPEKRIYLLAERAYYLIQKKRMKDIRKEEFAKNCRGVQLRPFNLYSFIQQF